MGGRAPMIGDDEIVEVFREASDPFLGTQEVADKLPIGREGALKRLRTLENEGRLRGKKIGNVLIWWLPEIEDVDSDT